MVKDNIIKVIQITLPRPATQFQIKKLRELRLDVFKTYINIFEQKQNIVIEDYDGRKVKYDKYEISIEDIITDIEMRADKGLIFTYLDTTNNDLSYDKFLQTAVRGA